MDILQWSLSYEEVTEIFVRVNSGFEIELGLLIKNLIAFATGQSRFRTVAAIPTDTLKNAWKDSCRGMQFALNFLKQNVRIDSPTLLSSPFILITLSIYGMRNNYELTPEKARRLRFWVLLANAKGRYSRGSSETLLYQD
jgi:hypothetical protein